MEPPYFIEGERPFEVLVYDGNERLLEIVPEVSNENYQIAKEITMCEVKLPGRQIFINWRSTLESRILTGLLGCSVIPSIFIRGAMLWAEKKQRSLIASINVINDCNLHCAGCYWTKIERKQKRNELSPRQGDQLIYDLWRQGVRQFLFIGGEPMMEREKLEQWVRTVASLNGIATVITNGTFGLPAPQEWPRVHYIISCDGDKAGMDKVRGVSIFEQVKAVASHRQDVVLAMTINKLNVGSIEAFMREVVDWKISGVVFSFATPNVGESQLFYLSDERKEQVVQELLRLKREYKDFIVMSTRAIELLRPAEVVKWSANCPTFAAKSIRADGRPIERCIFGPQGDCDRCGCNVSTSFCALREGDKETARLVTLPAVRAGIR